MTDRIASAIARKLHADDPDTDRIIAASSTPVSDALAEVSRIQANRPGDLPASYIVASELAALRDLADAVRSHGIGEDLAARRLPAVPVPDVTEHHGYTVRAVVAGDPAVPGKLAHWYVAAEGPEGWATWTVVLEHGRLLWVMPHKLSMPEGQPIGRAEALAELAERAGIAAAPPF